MSKPRLPTDISFLLESVTSETPLGIDLSKKKQSPKLVEPRAPAKIKKIARTK
jgi:hypothetical protein